MSATKLLKFVDKYIFVVIIILCSIFTRKTKKFDNKKKNLNIAFVKVWAMGDAINTLPMIRCIKEKYPDCNITIITKESLIPVYNEKFIDKINIISFKNMFKGIFSLKKYDLVFDLEPYLNSSALLAYYLGETRIGFANQLRSKTYNYTIPFQKDKHLVRMYMDMLKFIGTNKSVDSLVPLAYSPEAKRNSDKILRENNIKKNDVLIGFCAGVGEMVKEREWGKENYRRLAEKIIEQKKISKKDKKKNIKIILIGTNEDREINYYIKNNNQNIIDLSGQMNLETLFAFMKNIKIFVSNDTGPMHIAAAQGCKTIGLFGPNTPSIWGPYGKKNISIFHPKKGCPFLDNTKHELIPKKLTIEQKTCMDAIGVDEVYRAVKMML